MKLPKLWKKIWKNIEKYLKWIWKKLGGRLEPLGASGTGFGSSGVPIGNEPIAILSKRWHSVPFCAYDSIPFRCTRLHCIVFHSILSGLPEFRNRMLLSALWLRKVCVVLFGSRESSDAIGCSVCPVGLGGTCEAQTIWKTSDARIFAKFSRIFRKFFDVFASFSRFSDLLGPVRTCSDLFGCIRMHLDAFGSVRTRSENFGNFGPKNAIFAFLEGILTAWTSSWPPRALLAGVEPYLGAYVGFMWGGVLINIKW